MAPLSAVPAEHHRRTIIVLMTPTEAAMTNLPIDPAATPEDPDAPAIAADDAGASAAVERMTRQAANDDASEDDGS
jgi:hypothetical protein